jgi:uncharacterized protein YcfJ
MKKIIITSLILLITNISFSFASQFRTHWGVVLSVIPVSYATNISEPYTRVICKKTSLNNNFADIAVGGLIGSVIGNQLSSNHGAGAIGALFGSMMAIDNSNINHSETCYEKTYYSNQKLTKISHYNIKVRTKNRILNMKSSIPYNVHDIIYLD